VIKEVKALVGYLEIVVSNQHLDDSASTSP
jgi:hypothetical protein